MMARWSWARAAPPPAIWNSTTQKANFLKIPGCDMPLLLLSPACGCKLSLSKMFFGPEADQPIRAALPTPLPGCGNSSIVVFSAKAFEQRRRDAGSRQPLIEPVERRSNHIAARPDLGMIRKKVLSPPSTDH